MENAKVKNWTSKILVKYKMLLFTTPEIMERKYW